MSGPHSKLISAVLAWFKADFSLFQSPINTTRFGLILAKSSWLGANRREWKPSRHKSSWVNANLLKKKKVLRLSTNVWAAASDSGVTPSQLRSCFIDRDPYIMIKARELIRILSRSVPVYRYNFWSFLLLLFSCLYCMNFLVLERCEIAIKMLGLFLHLYHCPRVAQNNM